MNRRLQHYQEVVARDLEAKLPQRRGLRILDIHLHISLRSHGFDDQAFLLPGLLGLEIFGKQKAQLHFAKNDAAHLKLRKGQLCGISTKIRGPRIYTFMDNLLTLQLPASKAFEGFGAKAFDRRGNLHFRLGDLITSPEIQGDYREFLRGGQKARLLGEQSFLPIDVSVHTTARNPAEGKVLLSAFQFPIS